MYEMLKHSHMMFVMISVIFFIVRGIWMLRDSEILQRKIVKIAPHIIDSLMLVTGISLVFVTQLYPWAQAWLGVKLLLLVAYIVLGVFALKRGKTKRSRAIFFGLAVGVVVFMMSIARAHNPLGFLA